MNFVKGEEMGSDKDAQAKAKKKEDKVKAAHEKKRKQEARDRARGKVAMNALPTAFGGKKQTDDEMLGLDGPSKKAKLSKDDEAVGNFEKHTKGIGMKLLMKMGFKKGEGLGKTGGGVTQALTTKLRPKGVGVGIIQEQSQINIDQGKRIKRMHKVAVGEEYISTDEDSETENVPEEQAKKIKEDRSTRWRKGGDGKAPKTVYKTADQVAADGMGGPEKTKIIDMRGPQTRTIVNLSGLQTGGIPTGFEASGRSSALPELQHNMNCLIDEAELDIQDSDRKVRRLKDAISRTEVEASSLSEKVSNEEVQIKSVMSTIELITRAKIASDQGALNLVDVEKLFSTLKEQHSQEYRVFRLSRLAVGLVFPLVTQELLDWVPMEDPARISRILIPWKKLLQSSDTEAQLAMSGGQRLGTQISGKLLEDVILPAIRPHLVNDWDVRDIEGGFRLFEALEKVFEPSLFSKALDQLLLPKLKSEVDSWRPKSSGVPVHKWLLPWVHLAGEDKLSSFYPTVRHKINGHLENWIPSDPTAKELLAPWHKVFDAQSWGGLMSRCIVPKLQLSLSSLRINPADDSKNVTIFQEVAAWAGLVEEPILVQLLLGDFFPKWHLALYNWMIGKPNFEEVQRWYQGWRSLMPSELTGNTQIKAQFTKALDLMNAAVAGQDLTLLKPGNNPGLARPAAGKTVEERKSSGKERERSFKEVVEDCAAEANMVLMPTKLQHDSGKAVFAFGPKLKVYLDNSVVFYHDDDGDWKPIALDDIAELAHSKLNKKK